MTRTPTARQVLIKALELIKEPEHWTQKAFARSKAGRDVTTDSPRAHSFCMLGAICRASRDLGVDHSEVEYVAQDRLIGAVPDDDGDIAHWQDAPERTHPDIVRAMRRAIRGQVA